MLDKSAGVKEEVTTEPQEKVTPQGMNAEEDALLQEPQIENPIEQKLAVANDRESFIAIRDEIKKCRMVKKKLD